jgi:riboflavin kinase/FMN adenylyltransferase
VAVKVLKNENTRIEEGRKTAVALGMFDGLHIGHMALIEKVKELAKEHNWLSAVYSFHNHPYTVLNPAQAPAQLLTPEEKLRCFSHTQIDYLLWVPFSFQLSGEDPEDFIKGMVERYDIAAIVAGFNYKFGSGSSGDADMIRKICKQCGVEAYIIEPVCFKGLPVSSTRIRRCLAEGELEDANAMLGRPYSVCGKIVRGKQLGRTIGFPTANIEAPVKTLPRFGVYATEASIYGKKHHAITNIGKNPTVSDQEGKVFIETSINNYDQDIYGSTLKIEFRKFLREEKKFGSVEDLKQQITKDIDQMLQHFQEQDQNDATLGQL